MTDRILGFQVVLLDEQGSELQRIADLFNDDEALIIGATCYALHRTAQEGGQCVRYFKRVRTTS